MQLVLGTGAAIGAAVAAYYLQPLRRLKRARAKITLKYFNIDGLGEPIRLALAMAGVSFEDHRFKERSEFIALKPSLTFGQVPALFVDGTEMVQSAAVMRYIGQALDPSGTLYPSDPVVAQKVDAMADQVKDMVTGRLVYKYKVRIHGGGDYRGRREDHRGLLVQGHAAAPPRLLRSASR